MGCQLQVENTRNCNHQFYIVKVRPSLEEIKKDEANKKYHLLCTAERRINKEIKELKADEEEINHKLKPMYGHKELIKWKSESIKRLESYIAEEEPPKTSVQPRVIYLAEIDAKKPLSPDQKRCQKRLINKGRMDLEYLQQVEEELLSSKRISGMTSCGTQELNDLMNGMAQRIQHGSKNRKEEMKIHHKLRELNITREIYTAPEPKPKPHRWRNLTEEKEQENTRRYKESLMPRVKDMLLELEILRKDYKGCQKKITKLEENLRRVKDGIFSLVKELKNVETERKNAYDVIKMLAYNHKQKSCYDEYQSLLTMVAQTVDVAKVKRRGDTQVERFMAEWNDNQAFRDDYQFRRILTLT